jgi:16S rRNA (cytidine1402-2'-O)-methyltransferase
VTTLLSAAGVAQDGAGSSSFVFAGFLPAKAAERAHAVQLLAAQPMATVLLEAPHRMEAMSLALEVLGARKVTLGRELTKQFEEIATMQADGLAAWLAEDGNRLRGEFVLVVHPLEQMAEAAQDDRLLKLLLEHLPLKTAVKLAADISGEPRNALYERALALKAAPGEKAAD